MEPAPAGPCSSRNRFPRRRTSGMKTGRMFRTPSRSQRVPRQPAGVAHPSRSAIRRLFLSALAGAQHDHRQHRHLWRLLASQLLGLRESASSRPALLHSMGSRSGAECGRTRRRTVRGRRRRRHRAGSISRPRERLVASDSLSHGRPGVSRSVPGLCRGDAQHRVRAIRRDRRLQAEYARIAPYVVGPEGEVPERTFSSRLRNSRRR